MANTISDKDVEGVKELLKGFTKTGTASLGKSKTANTISDKDAMLAKEMLEKGFRKTEKEKPRDEKKSLKGKAFANGGKVDFKGSF